jgi:hypothetical protein
MKEKLSVFPSSLIPHPFVKPFPSALRNDSGRAASSLKIEFRVNHYGNVMRA